MNIEDNLATCIGDFDGHMSVDLMGFMDGMM